MSNKTLTTDRIAEIKARAIDFSDIRELMEADFSRGRFRNKVETKAKKPLSAKNIDEMLSRVTPGDFGENPASIQCFRELTKNDVWWQ